MRKGNRLRLDAVAPGASYMQLSINKIKIWCSLQVRREIIRVFIYNLKKETKVKSNWDLDHKHQKTSKPITWILIHTHALFLSQLSDVGERERERERGEMKRVREMG